mmetsp:Transcript_21652/g.24088  ORF Transcript_21652/g.24088 Transcript_21652/m.24088 type:complete len:236 (+) Transcript_21652:1573-2280(+)
MGRELPPGCRARTRAAHGGKWNSRSQRRWALLRLPCRTLTPKTTATILRLVEFGHGRARGSFGRGGLTGERMRTTVEPSGCSSQPTVERVEGLSSRMPRLFSGRSLGLKRAHKSCCTTRRAMPEAALRAVTCAARSTGPRSALVDGCPGVPMCRLGKEPPTRGEGLQLRIVASTSNAEGPRGASSRFGCLVKTESSRPLSSPTSSGPSWHQEMRRLSLATASRPAKPAQSRPNSS